EQVLLNRPPNQLELGTKSAERLNRLLGIRRQPLQSLLKLLRSRSTQRLTNTLETNNQGGDTRSSTSRQCRYQRQSTGSLSQPRAQTDRGTTDTGHSPSQRTQSRGSQGSHPGQTAKLHHRHQQTPAETETHPLCERPVNADTRDTTLKTAAKPYTGFPTLLTEHPVEEFALPNLFRDFLGQITSERTRGDPVDLFLKFVSLPVSVPEHIQEAPRTPTTTVGKISVLELLKSLIVDLNVNRRRSSSPLGSGLHLLPKTLSVRLDINLYWLSSFGPQLPIQLASEPGSVRGHPDSNPTDFLTAWTRHLISYL